MKASTVALSQLHMTNVAGPNKPRVTGFKAGAKVVYFDYTVLTQAQDTGTVNVLSGGINGKVVASANLFFGAQASFYATLKPKSGVWPNGAYCAALEIDGENSSAGGAMPISWTVGPAQASFCGRPRPPAISLNVHGVLRVNMSTNLAVVAYRGTTPVAGARLTLSGKSVGLGNRTATTNSEGKHIFVSLHPKVVGKVTIAAAKKGYIGRKVTLTVSKQ